jgi:diaminopimelate epimerase
MNKDEIQFYKYQGTGNDFIIIHSLDSYLPKEDIINLCDRKYGIGADGIIFMNKTEELDFKMMYFNADGSESFCGNGSRCAVKHAQYLGWISDQCKFTSNDGEHAAAIDAEMVKLEMHDVDFIVVEDMGYILNTGSPHYIAYTEEINELDLIKAAHEIRYSERFKEVGINVNYLEPKNGVLHIRTYERGVEDETLSCGTGATAAAIAHYLEQNSTQKRYNQKIKTKGGNLNVSFEKKKNCFENIVLGGPANLVFQGNISLNN